MQLVIDIGNSNVVIGIYKQGKWQQIWRIPTTLNAPSLFYKMQINNHLLEANILVQEIQQIVISSVVPPLTEPMQDLCLQIFGREPLVVGPEIYPHIPLEILNPYEIGADLVANAVAAKHLFQKDSIIVDFGTALTFTTVNQAGKILGVSIAPGLKTAIGALVSKTAQLPEVPLKMPASILGINTETAIQTGVLTGYVGLVRHLLQSIRAEIGHQYIAIATGGLSSILTPLKEDFEAIDPNLTLNGLRVIGDCLK